MPSQKHSLQPTIPHPLYPILNSAATLNTEKEIEKSYFPFQCSSGECIMYPRAGCTACHLDLPQHLQWSTIKFVPEQTFRREQEEVTLGLKGNSRQFLQF